MNICLKIYLLMLTDDCPMSEQLKFAVDLMSMSSTFMHPRGFNDFVLLFEWLDGMSQL